MAMVGTARNIPRTPKVPPPMSTERIISKGLKPTDFPRIFGPKYNPSNC